MKKKIGLIAALLLLSGIIIFSLKFGDEKSEPELEFKTTKTLFGDLKVKISATGVVEPNFQVEVKSKASGEVLKFSYEEGDKIKKGQLLIQLDKSDELRNVARTEANVQSAVALLKNARTALILQKITYKTGLKSTKSQVEEAEANLQEAKDKLQRQEDLHKKKFASQEALDQAKTLYKVTKESLVQAKTRLQVAKNAFHDITLRENDIELAKSEVTRAKIEMDEAKDRLSETEIFAPITGTIIKKMVEEGQIISSGISNVSGGTALCSIADMKRLFIIADVDETDIGSVKVNQPVTITTDAFPGKTLKGKVQRIAPKGEVEESITIFKVKLEITGQGKSILKPMMTANVDIISKELEQVLYLPREAVRKKKNKHFVAVLEGDTPKEIPVEAGVQNPIHIQIVSGIQKDQEVLVGDWEKVVEARNKNKDKSSTLRKILWMIRSK